MPTYKGVEVWIEDSEYRKLDYKDVSIDLVDDRTVTARTQMLRDERYTVHCLSPVSVFCDVFVVSSTRVRTRAARFHLDKTLAISEDASASSMNHAEGRFKEHGLRTPPRSLAFQQGRLGTIEVEVRRIGEIIRDNPQGECEVDGGITDIFMTDDFDQSPWLVFRFDIHARGSLAVIATTPGSVKRNVPRRALKNRAQAAGGAQPRSSGMEGSSTGCLRNSKKRPRRDGSATSTGENCANPDQLQKEFEMEEAEERRLLQKLQEQLEEKKKRNVELRRLLGETP